MTFSIIRNCNFKAHFLFFVLAILTLNTNAQDLTPTIEVSTEPDNNGDYGLCIGNDSFRGNIRYAYHEGDSNPNDSPYYYLALKGKEGAATEGLFLTTDGITIIGTADPCYKGYEDSYRMFVEGNLFVEESAAKTDGSAFWTVVSDPNLRTRNLRTISKAATTFKQLKVYEYEASATQKARYGIMPQELQQLLPQSVAPLNNKKEAPLAYNLNDVFFLHIQTTQELAASLETAEAERATLKAENDLLKEELQTLKSQFAQINQALEAYGMGVKSTDAEEQAIQVKTANKKDVNLTPNNSVNYQRELLQDCQPNPLNQSTLIPYEIPPNTKTAKLTITNSNGQLIQTYPLTGEGEGQLIINAQTLRLNTGNYFYSLWLDGEKIATKQMILVD